ncbi:MAG: DUF4825 domain-containing protein [Firmicutes bacterium]|nr:DUF4825 domain-containing protein [Bacillota bacterium]
MNQEKIGKFICECRKKKNLTQLELAELLGVSDRTVGNWENGRNMPDLSLFKPLCDAIGISINELLSGEIIKEEKYQEKFEENIINTIDYSTKKIRITKNSLNIILLVFGIIITFSAMTIFPSDSSWGSTYSIFGIIITTCGIYRLTKRKKIILSIMYFIISILFIFLIDTINTIRFNEIPRFCIIKTYSDNILTCDNGIFKTYKINNNSNNEYVIVDFKHKYNENTIPIVPFNRNKSSIDNIIKYKNKYIGNNSNTGNLIGSLPLSEYGYVFEIDSDNLGLTINYHVTDWYINENQYLEKSLIYNSISIFFLIDNVNYIKYNFSGKTFVFNRNDIVENYPNYNKINKNTFNKLVEKRITDDDFINNIFNKIIT